jgi:nucleoside 2-deoxyribosyltransferase
MKNYLREEGDGVETVKVYLSGSMMNSSWEEQTRWRRQIRDAILCCDCSKNVHIFDPTQYYNYEEKLHKSEREVMEFELNALRKSDLVIVNLKNSNSIGTAIELAIAKELRIPVIAFGIEDKEIHSWILECCTRVCDSMGELMVHIVDFYLN